MFKKIVAAGLVLASLCSCKMENPLLVESTAPYGLTKSKLNIICLLLNKLLQKAKQRLMLSLTILKLPLSRIQSRLWSMQVVL